jgi:hypothetical protein
MSVRPLVAAAAALVVAIAACSAAVGERPGAMACAATFSAVRCSNMADYAAFKLHMGRDEIVGVTVLPPPTPEVRDGKTILQTRSGGPPVDTLVTLRDGSIHEISMDCAGIPSLQCQDAPHLQATSVTMGGYFDTACTGDPPKGCQTAVPPADAAALAAAVPLYVVRFDIPIDHDGHYEVAVGEARLPNGLLTVADFGFVSPDWPSDMTIADGVVGIVVRSLDDPPRAFMNVHEHGRVAGVERVAAVLVFDVLRHDLGAILSVRDVVVR